MFAAAECSSVLETTRTAVWMDILRLVQASVSAIQCGAQLNSQLLLKLVYKHVLAGC